MANYNQTSVPMHHVVVKRPLEGIHGLYAPILYIEIDGKAQCVNSLVEYFLKYPNRSYDWRRKVARSLGLFYDYVKASVELNGEKTEHRTMMRRFGLAILSGTVSPKNPDDPLGLYWPPSSIKNTKRMINTIQAFVDWCIGEGITEEIPTSKKIDSGYGYIKYLARAQHIKNFSFLGHTVSAKDLADKLHKQAESQILDLGTSTNSSNPTPKVFPSWLVSDLIQYGFIIDDNEGKAPHEREDITAKMITIMLLFGGVRISEPFHLWFHDVIPQIDGSCKVFLRHPSDSKTNIPYERNQLRKQYLAERGMYPRNTQGLNKSYFVGWKELDVNEEKETAVFFLHRSTEYLFRSMFLYYLNYREELMKIYKAKHGTDHPFLFVGKGHGYTGQPYSAKSYRKALKRAYNRLEKKFGYKIPRGKQSGTSPHGMRHFYGQSLIEAGIDSKVIQKSLHHRSILSQGIYTNPSDALVMKRLEDARANIEQNQIDSIKSEIFEVLQRDY